MSVNTLPISIVMNPLEDVQIINASLNLISIELELVIDIINLSDKCISCVYFEARFYNDLGKYIYDEAIFKNTRENIELKPKKIGLLEPFELDERYLAARGMELRIAKILYSDGTTETYNFKDQDFYFLDPSDWNRLKRVQSLYGEDAIVYGRSFEHAWRCVCGVLNTKDAHECRYCNRNQEFVLKTLTKTSINERLGPVGKEGQTLNTASIRQKKRANQTQRTSGRVNNDSNSKPKKNSLFRLPILIIIILLIASAFIGGHRFLEARENKKQLYRAEVFTEQGDYTAALEIYKTLPSQVSNVDIVLRIQDTKLLIASKNSFLKAQDYLDEEKYIEAIEELLQVIPNDSTNYKISQKQLNLASNYVIEEVKKLNNEGKTEEAKELIDYLVELRPSYKPAKNIQTHFIDNSE